MDVTYRAFNGHADWAWINEQIPLTRVEDTCGIMAVNEGTGELIGACVLDNWTANSVQGHFIVAHPMLLRHGFIECVADFIFIRNGCKFLYALVPSNNAKAIKLNGRIGFTEKTRMPDAYADGIDFILMELKRDNCKFLEQNKTEEAA